MNSLKSLFAPSIRRTVTLTFIFIAILIIGLVLGTFVQLGQIRPTSEDMVDLTALQGYSRQLISELFKLDGDLERYITVRSPEYQESVRAEMQGLAQALDGLRASPQPVVVSTLAETESVFTSFQEDVERLLNESDSLSAGEINRLIVSIYADLDALKSGQQKLSDFLVASIRQDAQRQTQIASRVQGQNFFIGILAGLIAVVVAVVTDLNLRSITRLTAAAEVIARGDLTERISLRSRNELGILADTFNKMAAQLQESIGSLEERVADRTRALQTSAEVSRRLSAATDPRQLAAEVVEQLQSAFHYYHAHIYFFDEQKENLLMAGGTGEAGASMLASGHRIARGRGLVGRAAETNAPVLVEDVSKAIGWLPNPLLPETKSELAVPVALGQQVLGVIDVQQNRPNGLDENDAALLQSIAGQVAISLQNARTFEQSRAEAELETLVNAIGQKIQNATSAEETLQVVLQELTPLIGAQRAAIVLESPADEKQLQSI